MQGISVRDRAVHLDDAGVLVVSDVHVGRGEASGVTFPLGERADLAERLSALVAHFDPVTVVFAGDIVHAFDEVSPATDGAIRRLVDVCRAGGADPVLLEGNHDGALRAFLDGGLESEFVVESAGASPHTVVCHGHQEPGIEAERYVIGHDHPVIEIAGDRHPCVLYGEGAHRGADVVVVPAFNRLSPGVVVNGLRADGFDSPLVRDLDVFRPFVWDADCQETLAFPPLGEFRRML